MSIPRINDQFSCIRSKAKRWRERKKFLKLCARCDKVKVRKTTICKGCRIKLNKYEENYRRGPRKSLSIRILKLEHDVYELKLLLRNR